MVLKLLYQKKKLTQWYTGGHEYNLFLDAAGGDSGGTSGLEAATEVLITGVVCPVALVAGIFGGGKLGARIGKREIFFFIVIGQKDDGSNFV